MSFSIKSSNQPIFDAALDEQIIIGRPIMALARASTATGATGPMGTPIPLYFDTIAGTNKDFFAQSGATGGYEYVEVLTPGTYRVASNIAAVVPGTGNTGLYLSSFVRLYSATGSSADFGLGGVFFNANANLSNNRVIVGGSTIINMAANELLVPWLTSSTGAGMLSYLNQMTGSVNVSAFTVERLL